MKIARHGLGAKVVERLRNMTKIAIVGGGLAGISAARHALSHGFEVELFEESAAFGGRLASTSRESFVIDRGFQIVNVNYPELKLLLATKKVASKPMFMTLNFTTKRKLRADISPFNLPSLISPASGPMLQKIRFLLYLFSKIEGSPSLLEESKKFKDMYELVLGPFLSGVFLTDPRNIRGDVAKQILRYFLLGRPHLIDGGVANLIPSLLEEIPAENLHSRARVTQILSDPSSEKMALEVKQGEDIETFGEFDFLVIATNGKVGEIAGATGGNSREWLSSTTVYHAINKSPQKNLKLFVGSSFVNSLVISDANQTYSEAKESLIATTYLGEISDSLWQETKEQRESEIASLYKCSVQDLRLISIESISHSLPFFATDEPTSKNLPINDSENDRIFYAGDAFDEPSQNGALRSGRVAIFEIAKRTAALY
jgi:hypothetical protein